MKKILTIGLSCFVSFYSLFAETGTPELSVSTPLMLDNSSISEHQIITDKITSLLPPWNQEGGASYVKKGCLEGFQLTTAGTGQKGCVWDSDALDFTSSFEINAVMNFGSSDAGADGICMVFKSSPDGCGPTGGAIGAGGLMPSFIVEFDTYDNGAGFSDIPDDHVAVDINGNINNAINGPISLGNIEDGADHDVRFVWDAGSQNYEIYFDGGLKLSGVYDIAGLLGGTGYLGYTASTGGAVNNQTVYTNEIDDVPDPPVFIVFDLEVCENAQNVPYAVDPVTGITYIWTVPSDASFTGGNSASILVDFGKESGEVCVVADNGCKKSDPVCVNVTVTPLPEVTLIDPPVLCNDQFDLTSVTLNGLQANEIVTYHATETAAKNGTPELPSTIVSISGTYWIRIEAGDDCYIVLPIVVEFEKVSLLIKGPNSKCAPGFINLLTDITVSDLSGLDLEIVSFHATDDDAIAGSPILSDNNIYKSTSIWVRGETINGCFDIQEVIVTILDKPEIAVPNIPILCFGDTLFLNNLVIQDTSGTLQDTLIFKYFLTENDAQSNINFLNPSVLTAGDTIWVRGFNGAGCFDLDSFIVKFGAGAGASLSGNATVCPGDSVTINFNLLGTAPYNIQLTDGTNIYNFTTSIINFSAKIPIFQNTNISWTKFETGSTSDCVPQPTGTAVFLVHEIPNITLVAPAVICKDSLLNFTIIADKSWPLSLNYTLNGQAKSATILQGGTVVSTPALVDIALNLTSVTDANGCTWALNDQYLIPIATPPTPNNLMVVCSGTEVVVSFDIIGGDNTTYSVNGSTNGISNNSFNSGILSSPATYSYSIDDANGCGPVLIQGLKDCSCISYSGTIQGGQLDVCVPGDAIATNDLNEVLDANDNLIFVLHDLPGQTLGTIVASNNIPSFVYDPLTMQLEKTYYISAVAGNSSGTNQVNLLDPCLSVSSGTPVVFHAIPMITFVSSDTICAGEEGNILIEMIGNPDFTIQINTSTGPLPNLNSTLFSALFKDSPSATSIYNLSISDKYCVNPVPINASIFLHPKPFIVGLKHICNPDNTSYTVEFEITDGDPNSYNVTNGAGTVTGAIFKSNAIAIGQPYNFFVDDKFGCGPFIVAGAYTCICESDPGTISTSDNFYCTNQTIAVQLNGSFVDPNDVFSYVLSNSAIFDPSQVVWKSTIGVLNYNAATMTTDTKYYLFTVVGNQSADPTLPSQLDPCFKQSAPIEITFKAAPIINIGVLDQLTCLTSEIEIDASNSTIGTIQWSNANSNPIIGGTTLNPTVSIAGWYVISITEPLAGCNSKDSVLIEELPAIDAANFASKDPECGKDNGSLTVINISGGTQPFTYTIATTSNNTGAFINLAIGSYNIEIVDAEGCIFIESFELEGSAIIDLELGPDITVNYGEIVTLNAQIATDTSLITGIVWSNLPPSDCNNCLTPSFTATETKKIYLKVLSNDCEDKDVITVVVITPRDIYIPSAFSPNNDGLNDQLVIFGGDYVEEIKQFAIYNRWGEALFEANNFVPDGQKNGWNGEHKNRPMNPGVYVYYALVKFKDGAEIVFSGDINLFR